MKRVLLLQTILACCAVALLTVAVGARRSDPVMSSSMYTGSLHCRTDVIADSGWSITASQNFITPSGRFITPTCGWSTNYPPMTIESSIETPAWFRSGVWTCAANAAGSAGGGGSWTWSSQPTLQYDNPTCACAPPTANFALEYMSSVGFYVDIADSYQAGRVAQWLSTAAPWWNDLFGWVSSNKRIEPLNGAWPVRVIDLHATHPTAMMLFTNDGGWHIDIDQTAFIESDDQNTTWMGHELGHAIGAPHSPCDQDSSLMAAVVNAVHLGADRDAEKCWLYSEYSNLGQTCSHW